MLQPSEFVAMAESIGVINDMTLSILEAACEAARCMPSHLTLSLNLAPQQIQDDWLVEKMLAVMTKTGFSPRRMSIDISENAVISDVSAAKRVISSLKNLGARVALDDFGAGYSSLCYLSELSFDAIKIDASFVRSVTDRAESAKIVAAIVGLAKSFGIVAVAESVETESQAAYLRSLGCDAAQGYHFHKPMPAAKAVLALAPKPEERASDRAIA